MIQPRFSRGIFIEDHVKDPLALELLVRITGCPATDQTPESTRSSQAVKVGCSVSNSSWPVTSSPTPRQSMPNGSQSVPISGFRPIHQFRKPADACSGTTPLRLGKRCSKQGGDDAVRQFAETTSATLKFRLLLQRGVEQSGSSSGSKPCQCW